MILQEHDKLGTKALNTLGLGRGQGGGRTSYLTITAQEDSIRKREERKDSSGKVKSQDTL